MFPGLSAQGEADEKTERFCDPHADGLFSVFYDDHLSRLDLADKFGPDQVEHAGFGSDNPGGAHLAQNERAEPEGIAHRDHAAFRLPFGIVVGSK